MRTKRDYLLTRWGTLDAERSSWITHWHDLSRHLLPRAGRFVITDRNLGYNRYNKIIDSTGTRALRVLAAGLMAGMTSPARPWMKISVTDTDLAEYQSVKVWCNKVTQLILTVFAKSNTYRALHSMYEELGVFGTACSIVDSNFKNVIHCNSLTIGEYAISTNALGDVDTMYRQFEMTVGQLVKEFGYGNCSTAVQNLYDNGSLDAWIQVQHSVESREDRDITRRDSRNMPWRSIYFEIGSNEERYLRESGYMEFPVLAPRWAVSGGDIYGNGPGMEAMGDVKQLQHEQLRKGQAIDYQTNPPLQVPTELKNQENNMLPGGMSYYTGNAPGSGIRTAFEVNLDLNALREDIMDVRERIKASFYVDLFLMLAQGDQGQMTAREIAERHEEKLLMLGPTLERLHNEMLSPLIDITFAKLVAAGALPPPPQELQGQALEIEFVSMLAQAQRAVGTNSVDRLLGVVGAVAQFKPEVIDKINADKTIDNYADMLGVDPELIVADENVAIIRQQRARAQAQAAAAQAMPAVAQTAKTMPDTPTDGDNLLGSVVDQFSGYT